MIRVLSLCFMTLFFISCGGSKQSGTANKNYLHRADIAKKPLHRVYPNRNNTRTVKEENVTVEEAYEASNDSRQEIINYAKTFQGTRYKFGGTTAAGMDCSGLIGVAFKKENIELPRISRDIATKGVPISLREIEKGDLVFFKTTNRNVISHVGLVVEANDGEIKFIHSTTQAGVIISSLEETYWKKAFAEVRRII